MALEIYQYSLNNEHMYCIYICKYTLHGAYRNPKLFWEIRLWNRVLPSWGKLLKSDGTKASWQPPDGRCWKPWRYEVNNIIHTILESRFDLFHSFSGLIYDQTLLKMVFMECWWVTYPPVIKDGWLGNVINGHVNSNIIGLQGIFRKSLFDCQRIVTLWRLSSFAILIEEYTILHMNVW